MSQINTFFPSSSVFTSNLRSPRKTVSPFRASYLYKQQSISPRKTQKSFCSNTPNKAIRRTPSQKSPLKNLDNFMIMEETLKKGVGLFRQLANQLKMGSQKKQNMHTVHTTTKLGYSEKKKPTDNQISQNTFAFLIQNVKDIEIGDYQSGISEKRISFRNIDKKDFIQKVKYEKDRSNFIDSQKCLIKRKKNSVIEPKKNFEFYANPNDIETHTEAQKKIAKVCHFFSDGSPALIKSPKVTQNKEIICSFEDAIELIKKASEKGNQNSQLANESICGQKVQMSLSGSGEQESFNMNPFL